jgi:hypothetical protein
MATLQATENIMLRLYKRKAQNPMLEWANTYELRQPTGGTTAAGYTQLAQTFAAIEATLHFASTQYTRAVISTWVPDGQPYNPLSFITVPLTTLGAIDETGIQVQPLQICLRIAYHAEFGRQGFRLYRNALSEADVISPAGEPTIDFGTVGTRVGNFQDDLTDYIGTNKPFYLVLASASNIRTVTNVSTAGVTVKKLNNRYFDRVNAQA